MKRLDKNAISRYRSMAAYRIASPGFGNGRPRYWDDKMARSVDPGKLSDTLFAVHKLTSYFKKNMPPKVVEYVTKQLGVSQEELFNSFEAGDIMHMAIGQANFEDLLLDHIGSTLKVERGVLHSSAPTEILDAYATQLIEDGIASDRDYGNKGEVRLVHMNLTDSGNRSGMTFLGLHYDQPVRQAQTDQRSVVRVDQFKARLAKSSKGSDNNLHPDVKEFAGNSLNIAMQNLRVNEININPNDFQLFSRDLMHTKELLEL